MGELISLADARNSRKPAITTGSRRDTRISEAPKKPAMPRKGDRVQTIFGSALIVDDDLTAWCKGDRFRLLPSHIATPEHGVA